jgi:hypothetical protein
MSIMTNPRYASTAIFLAGIPAVDGSGLAGSGIVSAVLNRGEEARSLIGNLLFQFVLLWAPGSPECVSLRKQRKNSKGL